MIVLHEAGRIDSVEIVPPDPDPTNTSHVAAANPLRKIPTLTRPDGPALYDSRVICRYLDEKFELDLYPPTRLWDVLTLEATADGILDAAVLMVYEYRFRPEALVNEPWLDRQWDKVAGALDAIEERWMSHLAGRLDIAQIAVGCALGYLDFRHAEWNWRTGHEALADWFAVTSERESMVATRPA